MQETLTRGPRKRRAPYRIEWPAQLASIVDLVKDMARSTLGLAQEILEEGVGLVQLEIDLAKQEAKELLRRNGIAVGLLAFGALLLMIALLVIVPMLLLVVFWSNHLLGAIIWLAGYVVVGLLLVLIGRLLLRVEVPPRTQASLLETKEWALRQVKSNGK